jgi:hypothetical protein
MLLVATFAIMESTFIVGLVPSSTPPIQTIVDLVLDVILVGKGGTKGGRIKSKKPWGIGS